MINMINRRRNSDHFKVPATDHVTDNAAIRPKPSTVYIGIVCIIVVYGLGMCR